MRFQVYTVRDTVMDEYFLPFYARNDAHAQRLVSEQVLRDPEWRIHREELRLVHIGEFDPDTGLVEARPHTTIAIPDVVPGHVGVKPNGADESPESIDHRNEVREDPERSNPAKPV